MAARVLTLLPTQVSLFASGSKKVATSSSSSTTLSFELVDRRRVTLSSSFLGENISLHFCPLGLSRRDPDRFANEKTPNWSARAIKSFAMAEVDARKLKYPNTGTECLLMGILVEGTSQAAKFLRQNGLTSIKLREYAVELLGKNDMHYNSPMHPPLTEPAQRALDCAIDEKNKSGEEGEVTTTHMLLGIWAQKDSAGHRILAHFGFNDDMAGELAKSVGQVTKLSLATDNKQVRYVKHGTTYDIISPKQVTILVLKERDGEVLKKLTFIIRTNKSMRCFSS